MEQMHEIIDAVVDAGRIMLESGSEIYRSEETMMHLAHSFGLNKVDIFTLATCIYVTCEQDGDAYTRIRRIHPKATNLTKVSRINQLSRDMEKTPMALATFKHHLNNIERDEKGLGILQVMVVAIACALFSYMLQDCCFKDFCCTAVICFVAYYLLELLNQQPIHQLFKNMLMTIFMTSLAIGCVELGLGQQIDDIIIGCIMLVVPGAAMTNAIRDILNGDILSGTIRVAEALIIALGIVIGVGLALYIYRMALGG